MAKLTIKSLQADLAAAQHRCNENYETGRAWKAKADTAEAALKDSREHFADLKERLANAEAETARLRGYLDRVHEDDIVRDGMVEIEDAQGKRMVPKRPSPMMPAQLTRNDDLYSANHDFTNGGRKKRTHWTSY